MRAAVCFALLSSCATRSGTPGPERYNPRPAAEVWPDLASSLAIIRCAIATVDGEELAAKVVDGRKVLAVNTEWFFKGYYASGTILLRDDNVDAWHSPLRYELLCRTRLAITEGSPYRCTEERWKKEKPRYAEAIRACRGRPPLEGSALDLPGDAP